jgi:hypothetical protein
VEYGGPHGPAPRARAIALIPIPSGVYWRSQIFQLSECLQLIIISVPVTAPFADVLERLREASLAAIGRPLGS